MDGIRTVIVDGLDLIVGAVVSAVVAGLAATVAAFLAPFVSDSARSMAVVAWVTGGAFICGSLLTLSSVPAKDDLSALEPSVIHRAYVDKSLNGDVLRLFGTRGDSVTVSPRKGYYQRLVDAVAAGKSYRVLYGREQGWFSGDRRVDPIVFDVSVNGETLESYESRVSQLRLICSGAFAFGLVMLIGGFMVPPRRFQPA